MIIPSETRRTIDKLAQLVNSINRLILPRSKWQRIRFALFGLFAYAEFEEARYAINKLLPKLLPLPKDEICQLKDKEATERETLAQGETRIISCERQAIARIIFADTDVHTYLCRRHLDIILDALEIRESMYRILKIEKESSNAN